MTTLTLRDPGFVLSLIPTQLLLDVVPSATAAFSLRQLRSGVTRVVRVRRSSDNAQQDFTATQITDGTLTTFCSATNGFIVTWYDQSGNNRDGITGDSSQQPQCVRNGALIMEGASPTVEFNGSTNRLAFTTIPFSLNALHIALVARKTTTTTGQIFASNPDPNRIYVPIATGGKIGVGYSSSALAFDFGTANITSRYLWQLNAGTSSANAWRNGIASTPVSSSSAQENTTSFSLGSYKNQSGTINSFFTGNAQEVIIYPRDSILDREYIASNINSYYNIY